MEHRNMHRDTTVCDYCDVAKASHLVELFNGENICAHCKEELSLVSEYRKFLAIIRTCLQESLSRGELGIIAAKTRTPEGRLREFCEDDTKPINVLEFERLFVHYARDNVILQGASITMPRELYKLPEPLTLHAEEVTAPGRDPYNTAK